MRKALLWNANGGADLKRRAIRENVLAINHTPFVTPWWCAQMVVVVIDFIAAIPVFVFDGYTFFPFFVLDVRSFRQLQLVLREDHLSDNLSISTPKD
jgi:hypothetical protein